MVILCSLAAWAHHGTAVGTVAPTAAGAEGAEGPLSLGLSTWAGHFGRLKRGGGRLDGPAIDVALATFSVRVQSKNLFAEGRVPVGTVHTDEWRGGLGDVELLGGLRMAAVRTYVGMRLPTGRYATDAAVSFTDVALDGTTLLATTYDTRAGLGAGTWTARAGVVGEQGQSRVVVGALDLEVPLDRAPDGVRWGSTATASTGVGWRSERARVTGAVEFVVHADDQRWADDDGGVLASQHFGRRVGGFLRVDGGWRVEERIWILPRLRVPLHQWVQGVQLVEVVSGGVSVSATVGRREAP